MRRESNFSTPAKPEISPTKFARQIPSPPWARTLARLLQRASLGLADVWRRQKRTGTRDVGGRRRSNLGRLIMIRESIYCHLVVGETRRAAKHWARQLRCFQFSPRASDSGHNKATVRSPSWSLVGHSNERGARGQAGCICRRRRRTLFQGATRLAQSARSHLRRPIYLAERAVFLMSSPAR